MKFHDEYRKYRWFFTSDSKLVIGGKSAEQNDSLLKELKSLDKDFILMHTAQPGSPFAVIISPIENIIPSDIEECAIFTACFSKAWKENKKQAKVDVFKLSQIYKSKDMKVGTWGVIGKIDQKIVPLKLALTRQKNVLRAVPLESLGGKKPITLLCPGKIIKDELVPKLQIELHEKFKAEELLSAIPSGGFKIFRQ
jgi:hypothetical protein